jgi:hypothetical protein
LLLLLASLLGGAGVYLQRARASRGA